MKAGHLPFYVIRNLLRMAATGQRAWDHVTGHQSVSDEYGLLGQAVARLADERDIARASQQRMHKKVRELEKKLAGAGKLIAEIEFDHNRHTNAMIERHAEQIEMLKARLT